MSILQVREFPGFSSREDAELAGIGLELEGYDVSVKQEANGTFTLVGTKMIPSPGSSSSTVSNGPGVEIAVSDTDLEALTIAAKSEVGHFGQYGTDQLEGGTAAVVDTILNRVAHQSYPGSIQGVIDQPHQFSGIHAAGGWANLRPASDSIKAIVEKHLTERANGAPSIIKGATHFLNPYFSSQSALQSWGQHVVENPVAVFGNDAAQDVHYHGFPPGGKKPGPYSVSYNGTAAQFNQDGLANSQVVRQRIVDLCLSELAYFGSGAKKEDDDPQYKRVGEYWNAIGENYDGRTQISGENPAWSSAFVSYIILTAAPDGNFPGDSGHSRYFQHYVSAATPGMYEAHPVSEVAPSPGDIVHFGRSYAKRFNFVEARGHFAADGFYPSHSDIVVEVDQNSRTVVTVGGNVSNSVKKKTWKIDNDGKLVDRQEGGTSYPWIGILKLR